MNQRELNEVAAIKEKIELLKTQRAKAQGIIETLEAKWKQEYGFTSLEEAERKLVELEEQQAENDKRASQLLLRLEGLTNWASL